MAFKDARRARPRSDSATGFSLLELMVSMSIVILLMLAVFPFLIQAQKRFEGNIVVSEANQSARAALEVMSQEIGQAGYNPQFYPNKTSTVNFSPCGSNQALRLSDINGIYPGDWVSVDTGPNNELLEVFATSNSNPAPPTPPSPCATCPPGQDCIYAKFEIPHNGSATPFPVASFNMPFDTGILTTTSNDQLLQFYGDINQDGSIKYVVYSLSPETTPLTTVCYPSVAVGVTCPATSTYGLYDLYRSITGDPSAAGCSNGTGSVPFPSLPTAAGYTPPNNCPASPMVEKVLYNANNQVGPTGQPIFLYLNQVQVGVTPVVVTVTGTVQITLCIAVNPKNLETNQVTFFTMASQIRPLNLYNALNVNANSGALYIPPKPASLPMAIPTNYYP